MAAGQVRDRERAFYDAQAGALRADRLPPRPPDRYEGALLDALGAVEGLRVLELGCGAGDLSLELLRRGARLTAVDLSPAMAELAGERARLHRPDAKADFRVASAESLGLPAESFDLVVGKWVLHHADVAATAREVRRVLRPGGRAVFFENQARNPALAAGRRLTRLPGLTRVGTADEHPLTEEDMRLLLDVFGSVERSYPTLYLFEALGRALGHRLVLPLERLDALLWRRGRRLRRLGWHVLLSLERS